MPGKLSSSGKAAKADGGASSSPLSPKQAEADRRITASLDSVRALVVDRRSQWSAYLSKGKNEKLKEEIEQLFAIYAE